MVFHSAELRWFFDDLSLGEKIFRNSFPEGNGLAEPKRSDHYLKLKSLQTGVKLRQGNHELKLLSSKSQSDWGPIEMWTKWSHNEQAQILKMIQSGKMDDWLEIRKQRRIKKYRIDPDGRLLPISDERVDQGCGFELTIIEVPSLEFYTCSIGLEAFSNTGKCMENLIKTLRELELSPNNFEKFKLMSYPAFISEILTQSSNYWQDLTV